MKENHYELCILGGSLAGLSAAVRAKELGVQRVLVLEKMKFLGGCAKLAGGIYSVESPTQRRLGLHYTADECFRGHMDINNWDCDVKLVGKWQRRTGDNIRWLEEKGCWFTKVLNFSGEKRFYHMTEKPTGNTIIETLVKECQRSGVEILTEAPAKHLLVRDGKVVGVQAELNGVLTDISADNILIATGSISANEALLKKFYPGEDLSHTKIMARVPHNTGDGYLMAMEIGAAETPISTLYIGPHNHPYNQRTGLIMRRPQVVKLNRNGERFTDESMPETRDFGWMQSIALNRQPGKICYGIMDQSIFDYYMTHKQNLTAFEFRHGNRKNQDALSDYGKKEGVETIDKGATAWLDMVPDDIQKEADEGRIFICATLDEVAEAIGAKDPEIVKETIRNYNYACEQHYDAECLKDPQYLMPLTTPPYYVFVAYQGIDTCIGGIRVNHKLQVVDRECWPIEGLYCAGVAAGGWCSRGYGYFGSEMSFVLYSGIAVGEEVASRVHNQKNG